MKTINAIIIIAICYLVGNVACFHTDLDEFSVGWWAGIIAFVLSGLYLDKSGPKEGEDNEQI